MDATGRRPLLWFATVGTIALVGIATLVATGTKATSQLTDETSTEVGRVLADCEHPEQVFVDYMAATIDGWIHVKNRDDLAPNGLTTDAGDVLYSHTREPGHVPVALSDNTYAGIMRVVEAGGTVDVSYGDVADRPYGPAFWVIGHLPQGKSFVIGDCRHYELVSEAGQSLVDDRARAAVGLTGEALASATKGDGSPNTPPSVVDDREISVLDRDEMAPEELSKFVDLYIHLDFDEPLSEDRILCSKSQAGYNECIVLSQGFRGATWIGALVVPGETVVIYMEVVDEDRRVSEVEVVRVNTSPKLIARGEYGVRVAIDAMGKWLETSEAGLEIDASAVLDIAETDDWPAFGGAVEEGQAIDDPRDV